MQALEKVEVGTDRRAPTADQSGPTGPLGRFYQQSPIEAVLEGESLAAITLGVGGILALLWANLSPHGYESFWQLEFRVMLGGRALGSTLHEVVNDGLMTLFFVLAGIEMRREAHEGELSTLRKAMLPVAGAIGGMAIPALICFLFVRGDAALGRAWPIPMATDIAFAVAALTLLGKRVFPAMRVFLLTLAVADDMGAVAIIATAFSRGLDVRGLFWMAMGVAWMIGARSAGARRLFLYIPALALLWVGFVTAHIHPALAGVLFAVLLPVTGAYDQAFRRLKTLDPEQRYLRGHEADQVLTRRFMNDRRAYVAGVSPLHRAARGLLLWNPVILFLFSLANAGVSFREVPMSVSSLRLAGGIGLGLLLGKVLGITLASEGVIRLGWSPRPAGMRPEVFLVAGMMGGIGFTVANFTAALALPAGPLLGTAKLVITGASLMAAAAAVFWGRRLLSVAPPIGAASSNTEAEQEADR